MNTCIHTLLYKPPMKFFSEQMVSVGLFSLLYTWVLEHVNSYATLSPQSGFRTLSPSQHFPSCLLPSSWTKLILLNAGAFPCAYQNVSSPYFQRCHSCIWKFVPWVCNSNLNLHFSAWDVSNHSSMDLSCATPVFLPSLHFEPQTASLAPPISLGSWLGPASGIQARSVQTLIKSSV